MKFLAIIVCCLAATTCCSFASDEAEPRFIGGVDELITKYPYIVYVKWGQFFMTGTALNAKWVAVNPFDLENPSAPVALTALRVISKSQTPSSGGGMTHTVTEKKVINDIPTYTYNATTNKASTYMARQFALLRVNPLMTISTYPIIPTTTIGDGKNALEGVIIGWTEMSKLEQITLNIAEDNTGCTAMSGFNTVSMFCDLYDVAANVCPKGNARARGRPFIFPGNKLGGTVNMHNCYQEAFFDVGKYGTLIIAAIAG